MTLDALGNKPVSIPLFQQASALTCSGYLRAKFKFTMEPREWPKQMMGLFGCLFFASFTISF